MWGLPSVTSGTAYPPSDDGCELASITRHCVAWDKFNELLPVFTTRSFPSPPVEEFTIRASGAPCSSKRNLGPNLVWSVSPATQWPSYDLLDVRCHYQGPSQLARSPGEDAAWRSGKGTSHPPTQHGHEERSDGWLKKVQKLNATGCCGRSHPKKTRTKVVGMDCLALGLTDAHLPTGKLGVVVLEVLSDWTHTYTRDWLSPA